MTLAEPSTIEGSRYGRIVMFMTRQRQQPISGAESACITALTQADRALDKISTIEKQVKVTYIWPLKQNLGSVRY
jgi:hypothetical protein